MNGMPANITTTMATKTRFSMRAAEHALVAFVGTSARAFNHSCTMMATNGSANTPLDTSTAQMPLLTIQDTSVR
jgi:hypothetical protein